MKKRICLVALLLAALMAPGCNIYTDPAAYHYTDCKTPTTEYARYYCDYYGDGPGGPRCGCCGFIAAWAPCGQWCNQVQDDPCDWACPCACAH